MSNTEFYTMGRILRKIHHESRKLWDKGYTPEHVPVDEKTLDNYEKLLCILPPINEKKLENLLKKPRYGRLILDKSVYLPPLTDNKEFIPVIRKIKWKFKGKIDISLKIEMCRYIQTFSGGARSHLRCIGFRFEFHGASKSHDYMHVQITKQKSSDWLPTTVPCIPTIAEDCISLLFCTLVSLYGKNMYKRLFSGLNLPKKHLKPLKMLIQ